ncbi:voltage-dependent N-type calcium channel subunit alpha-1B [Sesbania bispinosa]|nr:voltage-dependent N-type calcium channel subunit alpha-1B [Sesbania bispinosa]
MMESERSGEGQGGSDRQPTPKPPDGGGGSAPTAEAVAGSGDKGVANHANPSENKGSNDDGERNSRQKNRGSNDEGEKNPRQQIIGIASKNKFHAISGGNDEAKEGADIFEPKIFKYDKPTSNSSQVQPPPKPCNVTDAGSQARETQVDDVSVAPKVYTHPHGISTTMNIEVVSPNHIRLLDDPGPPEHGGQGVRADQNMEEDSKAYTQGEEDAETPVDIVVETPLPTA